MNTHNIDYLTGFAEGAFTTLFTIAGVWVIFSLTEVLLDMERARGARIAAAIERDNLARKAGSALEEFSSVAPAVGELRPDWHD